MSLAHGRTRGNGIRGSHWEATSISPQHQYQQQQEEQRQRILRNLQLWHYRHLLGNRDPTTPSQPLAEPRPVLQQQTVKKEHQDVLSAAQQEIYQTQGTFPNRKAEGIRRLLYENINGLQPRLTNNDKLMKLSDIIHNLQADICCFAEHRINFGHRTVTNGPGQLFRRDAVISTTAGHNTHENISRVQEGGTIMVTTGKLNQFITTTDRDKDPTGLGRWVSTLYLGKGGCSTRVITAYNPCYNRTPLSGSSYQQHRRYFIRTHRDLTCPRLQFQADLIHQMKAWKSNGENLILCMDANQDIYTGTLGKELTDPSGLALTEPIELITGRKIGPTYFRGSKPIDAVWVSPSLSITNACVYRWALERATTACSSST